MTEPIQRTGGECRVTSERRGAALGLVPSGPFDLDHAPSIQRELASAEEGIEVGADVILDLRDLDHLDGAGAVLLARLLDRIETRGSPVRVEEGGRREAARLIALYRERRGDAPTQAEPHRFPLPAKLGAAVAAGPSALRAAASFSGEFAAALPKAVRAPSSVNWRSLPDLVQQIGADALPLTASASLFLGLIIGLLGVSELGRFGAVRYVPELVIVTQFRELGPLVTAILVAGRSGAGLASELGTMKVSEEIDALRVMGFDPMRWLVLPRCLALVAVLPLLTWVGDLTAVLGGMAATVTATSMTPAVYLELTLEALTPAAMATGLLKTPFLALAIGLIACGQGLATRGGAAAVGERTTTAVVAAMFASIVISSLFTFAYAFLGI
jgi:phospholipid/cholesterol/gamma-HCH transport system permease protein